MFLKSYLTICFFIFYFTFVLEKVVGLYSLFDSIIILSSILIMVLSFVYAYFFVIRKSKYKIIISTLLGYFFLSYFIKIFITLFDFRQLKNLHSLSKMEVLDTMPEASAIACVFILTLVFASNIFIFNKNINKPIKSIVTSCTHIHLALFICYLGMFLKVVVHYVLQLGIPGVEATGPPIIGGVITYFVRFALFSLVNITLYLAVKESKYVSIFMAFLACLIFCLIDLSIGSKYSFVYQLFILLYMVFTNKTLSKKSLIFLRFVVVSLGLIFLVVYKYINYYRFALLSGEVGINAIFKAINDPKAQDGYVVVEILNRIAGFENLIFALSASSKLSPSISSLFNSSFAVQFTEAVTGISGAINAVGATQLGVIALISQGNISSLIVLSLLIFIVLTLFSYFFLTLSSETNSFELMSLLTAIFCVYILFGSGNLIFYVKEFIITYLSIYLFCYFIKGKVKNVE